MAVSGYECQVYRLDDFLSVATYLWHRIQYLKCFHRFADHRSIGLAGLFRVGVVASAVIRDARSKESVRLGVQSTVLLAHALYWRMQRTSDRLTVLFDTIL